MLCVGGTGGGEAAFYSAAAIRQCLPCCQKSERRRTPLAAGRSWAGGTCLTDWGWGLPFAFRLSFSKIRGGVEGGFLPVCCQRERARSQALGAKKVRSAQASFGWQARALRGWSVKRRSEHLFPQSAPSMAAIGLPCSVRLDGLTL